MRARFVVIVVCCCLASFIVVTGCKKEQRSASMPIPSNVAWPAAPSDGAPLAIEMVSIVTPGKLGEAKVRVFNFTDKSVRQVRGVMQFFDATGNELTHASFAQADPHNVVGKKAASELVAGVAIPSQATSANIAIKSVEFGDGSTWEQRQ
ncbi:MAG: hypothetical protein AB7O24_33920 [Kofleriaceae bacterium]